TADLSFSQYPKSSHDDGSKPSSDDGNKVDEDPRKENECNDQEKEDNVNNTNNVITVSSSVNVAGTNKDNKLPFDPNMHALEDVSIFNFLNVDEDDGIVADINNLDTIIQAKRKDTQVPQPSGHNESVTDEVVHKELRDRLVRAATTASILEAEQDSGAKKPYGILLLKL
nr:hypothetical protein [Tanacetum cinerariifolium]